MMKWLRVLDTDKTRQPDIIPAEVMPCIFPNCSHKITPLVATDNVESCLVVLSTQQDESIVSPLTLGQRLIIMQNDENYSHSLLLNNLLNNGHFGFYQQYFIPDPIATWCVHGAKDEITKVN